ncbi:DUF1367 family protein [Escherichia coli]
MVGGPVGDFELLLCHGTVCVVGKIRDLILQLSKSSIYSTKPFHKRFFKLLQLGFDYWTPVGGAITPRERELLSGFVDYLCESVGREHTPALSDAAEQYLNTVATRRTRDTALLKSFEAFREWVTIQAGFYTEHIYPDGSRGRRAKSIAFANMDEVEFQQVYKSVLNVLWNWILFRKFSSQEEVENVAAQLLEFA